MPSPIETIKADIANLENAINVHKSNAEKLRANADEADRRVLVAVGAIEAHRKTLAMLESWKPDEAPAPVTLPTVEA